jgi:hypothetical protein
MEIGKVNWRVKRNEQFDKQKLDDATNCCRGRSFFFSRQRQHSNTAVLARSKQQNGGSRLMEAPEDQRHSGRESI